jgi:predicted small secreted protein
MTRLILAPVLVAIAVLVSGCNTMAGIGKDVERGGEKLQGAAKPAEKK